MVSAVGPRQARPLRSTELAQAIVDLITEQRLGPGTPLPTEAQLTTDLGASRGPLREAVKFLQALSIVEVRHGHGTFVGPASADAMLPWLSFRSRSPGTLVDLLDVREMLEIGLTRRLALAGVGSTTLATLRDCVAVMAAGDRGAADADRRFHETICDAAGNELARDLVRVFWLAYAGAEPVIGAPPAHPDRLAGRHAGIVAALAAGDERAAEAAVREHFEEVRARLRGTR